MAVERLIVCPVAHVKLSRMADGIGRVVRVVEEAEINRFEEPTGAFPQRQSELATIVSATANQALSTADR